MSDRPQLSVIQIAINKDTAFALRSDGAVFYLTANEYGDLRFSEWRQLAAPQLVQIVACKQNLVGVQSDGTMRILNVADVVNPTLRGWSTLPEIPGIRAMAP
jgi:hypothetical protein